MAPLREGERVQVQSHNFQCMATILYIAPGEIYPVQVQMDIPDPDGHRIYRFALHEIVKELPVKTESLVAAETSKDPERFLSEVIV